jgi:DNA-binding PadR family transcriptional regulator
MRAQLKRAVLLVLNSFGEPVARPALLSAVLSMERHARPAQADAEEALRDCESAGLVAGARDEFLDETTYTLTVKGQHKARQLA